MRTVVALMLAALILAGTMGRKKLANVLTRQVLREDPAGSGRYGAGRGTRKHAGVDLLVKKGDPVYSPVDGIFERVAYPYKGDASWRGLVLRGEGYLVKLFYMEPVDFTAGEPVRRGQLVGYAQDISRRYGGAPMRDHLHVEVRKLDGQQLDPATVLDIA